MGEGGGKQGEGQSSSGHSQGKNGLREDVSCVFPASDGQDARLS